MELVGSLTCPIEDCGYTDLQFHTNTTPAQQPYMDFLGDNGRDVTLESIVIVGSCPLHGAYRNTCVVDEPGAVIRGEQRGKTHLKRAGVTGSILMEEPAMEAAIGLDEDTIAYVDGKQIKRLQQIALQYPSLLRNLLERSEEQRHGEH